MIPVEKVDDAAMDAVLADIMASIRKHNLGFPAAMTILLEAGAAILKLGGCKSSVKRWYEMANKFMDEETKAAVLAKKVKGTKHN